MNYSFQIELYILNLQKLISMNEQHPAILVLEDGKIFRGLATGKIGTTSGEIAFNTGMTGYQEVFTDPSYYGQILIMTTAHIGNYGVNPDEIESDVINIAGLVTKKFSDVYSRASASGSLQQMMDENGTVGITDIDTRALVRHIRYAGAMNAIISSEILDENVLLNMVKEIPSMAGLELSSKVSTKNAYEVGDSNSALRVALVDFGVKKNIIRCLTERGCFVKVFPMTASLQDLKNFNPVGIMLSNGPGDPSVMTEQIALVKQITEAGIPVFGICLGHQLLGLSQGMKTEKMFNGHRGINHPVLNLLTGKGEITSQNHGFVIARSSMEQQTEIIVTHEHINDKTIAGMMFKNKSIFSVQYHPEASAGPHDSRYLFDQFVSNMKTYLN